MENNNYDNNKKKYKYASPVILFLIILFNYLRVILKSGKLSQYELGQIMGSTLSGVLVVFVVVYLLTRRMKTNKNKLIIIIGLIYLSINVFLLLGTFYEDSENDLYTQPTQQKIESMITSFLSGEDIIKEEITFEKYGDRVEIVEFVQNMYYDIQTIMKEYSYEVNKLELNTFLTEETIMNYNNIINSRSRIKNFIVYTDKYTNEFKNLVSIYVEKSKSIDTTKDVSRGFISGFLESVKETNSYGITQQTLAKEFIISIDEILKFFQERQGMYLYENNELQFQSQEDLDEYNELIVKYNEALEKLRKAEGDNQNKLKETIEDFEKTKK